LTAISGLTRLELRKVPITDAAVPHLARLTHLKELDISQTGITAAALAELKKALPQTKIVRDESCRQENSVVAGTAILLCWFEPWVVTASRESLRKASCRKK